MEILGVQNAFLDHATDKCGDGEVETFQLRVRGVHRLLPLRVVGVVRIPLATTARDVAMVFTIRFRGGLFYFQRRLGILVRCARSALADGRWAFR